VSAHSLYKRVKAVMPDRSEKQATELVEAKSEILRRCARQSRCQSSLPYCEPLAGLH
jgi:transposase